VRLLGAEVGRQISFMRAKFADSSIVNLQNATVRQGFFWKGLDATALRVQPNVWSGSRVSLALVPMGAHPGRILFCHDVRRRYHRHRAPLMTLASLTLVLYTMG
jgi:hypothetical protein